MLAGTGTSGADDVEPEPAGTLLERIGGEPAADRGSRGRAVGQVEAAVVLRALDDSALHQSVANLLRRRELTLKQIASMLGFGDEFHFSKAFKSQLGVSPSGFRERILRPGLETFSPKTHPTASDESR